MRVPFFDYTRVYASEAERYERVVKDVLGRSDFILRGDLAAFERELAAYTGAKHAIGVGNGTDAIWLALQACGIGAGDDVVLPSHTYVATAGATHLVGGTCVLADCGDDHLIDCADALNRVTEKTRAIIAVQLNGRTADLSRLEAFAETRGVALLEDAAQGLGSTCNGRMAGTIGRMGTYSFFPAKVLGCFGDGGAVVSNDDTLAERVRLARDHGRDENGKIVCWGVNSRLDNLQAAILLEKLKTFDRDLARRREIAALYCSELAGIPGMLLPPAPDAEAAHFDTYQNFEMEVEDRDGLRDFLASEGVGTIIQWGGTPLHWLPALEIEHEPLPRTDLLFQRAVMLPMNQYMSLDEAAYVAVKVREYYG